MGYKGGRDLKDQVVKRFLAKAQSIQETPAPCEAESYQCLMLGNPPLPGQISPVADHSHCENILLAFNWDLSRSKLSFFVCSSHRNMM